MIYFASWLLKNAAGLGDNHSVGGDYEGGIRDGGERVVQSGLVGVQTFLVGGLKDVFEWC